MTDVETQIRRYGQTLLRDVEPLTLGELERRATVHPPIRRRSSATRVLLAAALAVGIAVASVGVVAIVVDGRDDGSPRIATRPGQARVSVVVYFVDAVAFAAAREPYVVPVDRRVDVDDPVAGALEALFAGPTPAETGQRLESTHSGATGYTDLRVVDGVAHVTLGGGCSSGGSTLTIADLIIPTLKQFDSIRAVKIYAPDGTTELPDGPDDSIPECLEP